MDELSHFESEEVIPRSQEFSLITETNEELDNKRLPDHEFSTYFPQTNPLCCSVSSSNCSSNNTVSTLQGSFGSDMRPSIDKSKEDSNALPFKTITRQSSNIEDASVSTLSVERLKKTLSSRSDHCDDISSPTSVLDVSSQRITTTSENVPTKFPSSLEPSHSLKTTPNKLDQDVSVSSQDTEVTTSRCRTTNSERTLSSEELALKLLRHDGVATNNPISFLSCDLPNTFSQQFHDISLKSQLNAMSGLVSGPILGHPIPLQPPNTSVGVEERMFDKGTSTTGVHHLQRQNVLGVCTSVSDWSLPPQEIDSNGQYDLRPPPGIEINQGISSPRFGKESKYSSFDKLMDALKRRFPSISK